jgi:alpha-1,6-mannosyltransferase
MNSGEPRISWIGLSNKVITTPREMKRKHLLYVLGVLFTLIFCAELTVMGLVKYNSVLVNNFEEYNKAFPDKFTRLRIDIAYIGLTIVYVIWLFKSQERRIPNFSKVLRTVAIFLAISFVAFPRSTDIYLYLQYGLMGLNGINPYINSADSFTSNLSPFLSWTQTSTYGPVALLSFMISAIPTRISPLLGIYLFKLICVGLHIVNAYLIWKFLKLSDYRNRITIAYLINPLLLAEFIVSAHVDVLIANAAILLVICLLRHQYIAGIGTIWLGLLEKTLPIIWLPLVLNFLVAKRRWKEIVAALVLSLLIIIVVSYTALPTIAAWKSLINPGVEGKTALSLHYLLNASLSFLPIAVQTKQSILSTFKHITYLGFVIYYSLILLKPYLRRNYSEANLVTDIGWVTLVLFLFATPWLMPWYSSILLSIAALSAHSLLFVLTSLTFSLSSNFIYGGAGSGISLFSIASTITVIAPPIVLLLFGSQILNRVNPSKLSINKNYSLRQ